MKVLDFLDLRGLEYKLTYDNTEAKLTCPKCGANNGKFYINIETGTFICHRASCAIKGGPKQLVELFGEGEIKATLDTTEKPRDIPEPEPIAEEVVEKYHKNLLDHFQDPVINLYFTKKRGYTLETINKNKLGLDAKGSWVTPIRNDKGECVNLKFKTIPTTSGLKSEIYSIPGRGKMRLFNNQILNQDKKLEFVIICEGEPDCMKLQQEGYNAVTSTGGAGSFRPEWLQLFANTDKIFICLDNDANRAGQEGSLKIAEMFSKQKIDTFIVPLPNPSNMIDGKTDVTDFFTVLEKTKADFDLLLQCAPKYVPESKEKERVSIADELLEITRGAGVRAISDQRGEACLIYPDEPFAAYPLKGSGKFRSWIIGRYFEQTGSGVSGNTLKDVIDTIEAQASYENSKIMLWDRVGKDGNTIYYDLGNGRQVIKIDDKSWDILPKAPICFRRNKLQVEQVLPSKNGDLRELLKFVNIKNEGNQILFLTYLVAGLRPATPRPLLLIYGDQGSAKSTNLRMVRCLVDPSSAGYHPSKSGNLLSPPKDLEDLAGKTVFNYGLFFDNMSYCPPWLSDSLCRLITGSTYSKRMLYENFNEVVVDAMPLVAITGINQIADKSDLIDRTLLIEMERIPDNKRKEESELWRDFQIALPNILGGLFDILSKTLNIYPTLQMKELPRMADFGKFAAAAAVALGYPLEKFITAYKANIKSQNSNAIDSSPTAQMIINFVEQDMISSPFYNQKDELWHGAKAELYLILRQKAEAQKIPIGGHIGFPGDATWLWRKIKEVRPNLQETGIYIEENRTESKRSIILSRKPITSSQLQVELPLTENSQNKDDSGVLDEFKNEEGGQEA